MILQSLMLLFGRAVGVPAEQVNLTPVTVFVGPNNSGKSKVLSEIESYCRSGQQMADWVILESIAFNGLSEDDATKSIDQLTVEAHQGEAVPISHIIIESRFGRMPSWQRPAQAIR